MTAQFRNTWYNCSAHLVNCAFDQTCCATGQFINCAAFGELHNVWSIAYRTCNRVRVSIKVRTRVRVRIRASFRIRVRLGLELGLSNWPNVQHVWLNVQRVWSNAQLTKCASHNYLKCF